MVKNTDFIGSLDSKTYTFEHHDMFINGYFMLFFDLPTDLKASEGHTSHPENGNIRNA